MTIMHDAWCMMHDACVCMYKHDVASLYGQPEKDLRFDNRSWKAFENSKTEGSCFLQEWQGIVDKNRQFLEEDKTSNFYDQ